MPEKIRGFIENGELQILPQYLNSDGFYIACLRRRCKLMETTKSTEKTKTINEKPSIYSLQLQELKEWLQEHQEKAFRAEQIFEWLYKKRAADFSEMSNLIKEFA